MLTDHQIEVLASLFTCRDRWVTPMLIGGRDQSHHAGTLRQLVKRGLVETLKHHAIYCYHGSTSRQKLVRNRWVVTHGHKPSTKCCCKGSRRYRISIQGSRVLRRVRKLRA